MLLAMLVHVDMDCAYCRLQLIVQLYFKIVSGRNTATLNGGVE